MKNSVMAVESRAMEAQAIGENADNIVKRVVKSSGVNDRVSSHHKSEGAFLESKQTL